MKQPAHSCATVQELLLDYAYGELEGASRKDVESHVAGCADCRIALLQISGTRSLVAELEPEPAPEAGLESLLAYAQQAARNRAAETAKAPRAARLWSWLVPSLGFASAAAVALLFVVKTKDPTLDLRPALPSTVQAPAPRAPPGAGAPPAAATAAVAAKAAAQPRDLAGEGTAGLDAKREAKLEHGAKDQVAQDVDVVAADKSAEKAGPAKAPAKLAKKAVAAGDAADDEDPEASLRGAGARKGAAAQRELAEEFKEQDVAGADGPAAAQSQVALAQAERPAAGRQRASEESERAGKASGGGEAVGSSHYARQPFQAPTWGYVPAEEPASAPDRSKTASAGMSNVMPLDGAQAKAMPAPKPAAAPAPPPAAVSGYADAKKRDAREEQAPAAAVAAAQAAPEPVPAARAEAAGDDRAAASQPAAARPTPEELLRKGADQSQHGDYAGAEATWARFLAHYPDHAKAADVAMWRIEALERLGRTGDAAVARAQYARRWPNIGSGSAAGSGGPRAAPASPARAAPMEKARRHDLDAASETAR